MGSQLTLRRLSREDSWKFKRQFPSVSFFAAEGGAVEVEGRGRGEHHGDARVPGLPPGLRRGGGDPPRAILRPHRLLPLYRAAVVFVLGSVLPRHHPLPRLQPGGSLPQRPGSQRSPQEHRPAPPLHLLVFLPPGPFSTSRDEGCGVPAASLG